ncbi:IPTL-CTERM sorting domain-containing protein [Ottowia sp. SB7-C50]|uniref:IPTL-CTERM sorting domain-containing protein n=1 Tax=Ottowia sp. SB7-C50 TaxID=3081231 RepID=UPI002955CAF0|nr:IPTL-CTERM sorting domain-containing protein [Ottowia sp. SB7-C50]WOP16491.1 IPTL-CTERM sorting domain-containing protein [Ottowia sp. SB7-C50]
MCNSPVTHGQTTTCTAAANAGYTLSQISGCGGAVGSASPYTTGAVTGACTVTATFTKNTYAITGTASPAVGGSVSCAPASVTYGGGSTCTASASPGYTFSFFGGDCSGTMCNLTNIQANKAVTGTFTQNTYTVTGTASPAAGGTVTCLPSSMTYNGTSSCTATASPGYTFSAFSGDCIGATCNLTNIQANKTVTGTFTQNTYAVTGAADPAAGGSVSCTSPVTHGQTTSCTATANPGYALSQISGCGGTASGISPYTTGVVTAACTVTATFTQNTYSITGTASPPEGGTVRCSPTSVNYNGSSNCTATASTGYTFSAFSGDCSGAACNLSNIQTNKALTATFTQNTYAVTGTASPAAGGTVTCAPSPVTHGQTATCTVSTNAGFTLSDVAGCGGMAGASASYTTGPVTAACTVTASYTAITTFSGTTVPPAGGKAGLASASFTGGGSTCRFDVANTAFIAAPAPPPPGQTLAQGMFKFKLIGCDTTPVAMSVTWPKPVSGYTKYGKASSGAAASSYFAPTALAVSGHTATFTVADGQLGDDDWAANGSIIDPNGPVESTAGASSVTPVPTLGEWALLALSSLLGMLGMRRMQAARTSG